MNTKTNNISNGWRLYPLKEFYSVVGNLSLPREFLTKKEQNYGYIHYGDIHTQMLPEIINSDTPISYLLNTKKISNIENYFLQQGDIIVVDASEDYDGVAKAIEINSIKNKKIVAGLHTIALRPLNKNSIVSKFGPYLFKHPVVIKRLRAISQGTKVFSINFPLIEKVKFFLPPMEEQRRIVEVLECWDKGIELVKKLIEQKELQKKYLMQQLLSGNRRLKGFTDKWIIKKLENLLIQINERNRGENCYPILSVTNTRGIVRADEHFSKRVAGKDLSNYKIVHKGNFAYNPSRINVGSIALLDAYIAGLLSPMYVVFKCSQEIDLLYFKFLIQDTTFLTKVANSAQGSVRSTVDFEILSSIKIKFPSSKREQQAIAAVLSSADKEIDLLKQKQAKLEAQKKGLMQVLLTGKIRLK